MNPSLSIFFGEHYIMEHISFLILKTEYLNDKEGVKELLHYDDSARLFKDIPWAMRELVAICRKTEKSYQLIADKLSVLEQNGKTEEDNAVEISELAVEAKTLESEALEEATALYEKVSKEREERFIKLSSELEELQFKQNMCLAELRRRDIREKHEEKKARVYPNDPCPCGSGKKYKKCCGRLKKARLSG